MTPQSWYSMQEISVYIEVYDAHEVYEKQYCWSLIYIFLEKWNWHFLKHKPSTCLTSITHPKTKYLILLVGKLVDPILFIYFSSVNCASRITELQHRHGLIYSNTDNYCMQLFRAWGLMRKYNQAGYGEVGLKDPKSPLINM